MAVVFDNLTSPAGLTKLDKHLADNSYIGGCHPSSDDVTVSGDVGKLPKPYPHILRWVRHIRMYSEHEQKAWPEGKGSSAKSAAAEDDFDLFDDAPEKDSMEAAADKLKATKAAKKPAVVARSSLVIEIKPASIKTDLDIVWRLVSQMKIEGVAWGQNSKKVPIAFGLFKLQISCVILDELVSADDLIEKLHVVGMPAAKAADRINKLQAGEDDDGEEDPDVLVQSAEIVSFNKL